MGEEGRGGGVRDQVGLSFASPGKDKIFRMLG